MKTIITSVKGPPLRRVLCSFLFGAAAFCVIPTNGQASGDIVWVTSGYSTGKYYSIGKYSADGNTAIPNFITEPTGILGPTGYGRIQGSYAGYLGAILVSGHTLYVDTAEGVTFAYLYTIMYHPWPVTYIIATYDAGTGNVMKFPFFGWPIYPYPSEKIYPVGMALSGTNLYVATVQGQVGLSKLATTGGGNISFATPAPAAPYALAVNGLANVLYVTNNAQNSNGNFYISTYDATTGKLINGNLIEIPTGGLYGLALSQDNTTLYVSVYSGGAPGVHTYDVSNPTVSNPTGAAHERGPLFAVNQPWGIAIGSPLPSGDPTLYVASHQDSAIYEFDATTGELTGSIKPIAAPMNITVEPVAAALGP
jgi:hypothetical protein